MPHNQPLTKLIRQGAINTNSDKWSGNYCEGNKIKHTRYSIVARFSPCRRYKKHPALSLRIQYIRSHPRISFSLANLFAPCRHAIHLTLVCALIYTTTCRCYGLYVYCGAAGWFIGGKRGNP